MQGTLAHLRKARRLARAHVIFGLAVLPAAIALSACSKDSHDSEGDPGIGLSKIDPVANAPEAIAPVDATPSPDGKDVYFIAMSTRADESGVGAERVPAIFKAVAGGAPHLIFAGAPLVAPFGITISSDGQTLYLADSGADTTDDRSDGKVFTLGVSGGTPSALPGTEGLAPAGIEVMGDALFVTGKKDGKAGLFKTGLAGGAVTPIATGGPFVDPGGVAIAQSGEAYVIDTGSALAAQSLASVIRVRLDGSTEVVKDGLSVGHPAGIAMTGDDTAVLVSALDLGKGTDVVHRVELGSHEVRTSSAVIGDFSESAGLHRARNADVYAWADSHANKTGTVYVLSK